VILEADGRPVMVVMPAPDRVDLKKAKRVIGAREVTLASEEKFADLFPGCERGAEPPFGNLFDMPVYAEARLAEDDEIVFNAGTHVEAIRMTYEDFERLVKPRVEDLRIA
jgi:Ala-tRNA(Pro) deacylase